MPPIPLENRLQTQFLQWDPAPEAEIPEILMHLRAERAPLILHKEPYLKPFGARVTRLLGKSMQVELQNFPAYCDAFTFGGQVLSVSYGLEFAVAFLSQSSPLEGDILPLAYPSKLLIRRGRQLPRYPLRVAVSAQWDRYGQECIAGDVMDVSFGEDRGGVHMVTLDDGTRPYAPGEMGRMVLARADGAPWEGTAELRRVDRMALDARQDHGGFAGVPGFSLLGFALFLRQPGEAAALARFLEGATDRG